MSALPEDKLNPWSKIPAESFKAYQGFALFRDLGLTRTYAEVALALGKSATLIERWGAKWKWIERATAYDHYLEERRRAVEEDEWRRDNRRHRQVGRNQLVLGNAELVKWHQMSQASELPVMKPEVALALIREGVRQVRMTHNQPTELLRGVFDISAADTVKLIRYITETAERYMEEEVYDRFIEEVAGGFGETEERLGLEPGTIDVEATEEEDTGDEPA